MNPSPADAFDGDLRQLRSERSFNARVIGAMAIGFLTLILVGALAVSAMSQNLTYTALVAHTYQVESTIAEFRNLNERLETARRGYLLSHDIRFVSGVQNVRGQIDAAVRHIEAMTSDNPEQRANVIKLHSMLAERNRAIDVSIAFSKGGARNASGFYEDTGVAATRNIRALTDHMLSAEEHLLAARDRDRLTSVHQLISIAIVGALILVIVALASLLIIRRYTRDLAASRTKLDLLNRNLEEQVVARTAELLASNTRLEALLREVNHRVANSLQMVSAFVQLQASALGGVARSALKDTQRRIEAIIQVHRRLYATADVETVDMRDYLATLVKELEDTLSTAASPRTLTLEAAAVRLQTDKAVSVGVIVNELITNACKYAYHRGEPGEVRVRLAAEGLGLTLTVEDDGEGMPADGAIHGTGLGGRLIRAMAASLDSEVLYDTAHAGVRATLRLPTD